MSTDDLEHTPHYHLYESSNGTKLWTPNVNEQYHPIIVKSYVTLEELLAMCKAYNQEAGFNVKNIR